MKKNDFNSRPIQGDTKNKFCVQIKVHVKNEKEEVKIQEIFNKHYTSSNTKAFESAISPLKTLWGVHIEHLIQDVKVFHNNLISLNNQNFIVLQKQIKNFVLSHKNLRTTDSEFSFLADFRDIHSLKLLNPTQITRIEIHGFTTRDMCPCCFTHMGLFYDRLKEALQNHLRIEKNSMFYTFIQNLNIPKDNPPIELAFYISSSIQLGLQEFADSIYPSYNYVSGMPIYQNSVDQITKFYPEFSQSFAHLPSEGIFCTFIRDNNPNWSLQYYAPSEEKQWTAKNSSIGKIQIPKSNTKPEFTSNLIKCSLNNGKDCVFTITQQGLLKCKTHSNGRITPNTYTITIPNSNLNFIQDNTFRNLIQPWITEQVFNFAIGKANSLNINEKGFESSDSNFNNFLNSPSLEP